MKKRQNLRDIQRELAQKGELVTPDMTVTKSENDFAQLLLQAGIQLVPQFEVEGRSFDFKIFHYPILIEIDGGVHREEKNRLNDYRKDRFVQRRGYRVMRFSNGEVQGKKNFIIVKEVQSMMRHCGRTPREVYVYPLTIREQIMLWWRKIRGEPTDYQKEYGGKVN